MSGDAVRSFVTTHPRGSRVRGTVKEKSEASVHVELDNDVVGVLPKNELDSDVSSVDMIFGYISPGDPVSAFVLGAEETHVRLTKIERPSLFIGDVLTVEILEEEEDGYSVKLPSGSIAKLEAEELGWSSVHVKKLRGELKKGSSLETMVIDLGVLPKVSVRYLSPNPLQRNVTDFENPEFEFSILDPEFHWRNRLFMQFRKCGFDAPLSTPSDGEEVRFAVIWREERDWQILSFNPSSVSDEVTTLLDKFPRGFTVFAGNGPAVEDEDYWDAVQLLFWANGDDPNEFYKNQVKPWADARGDGPEIGVFHRLSNLRILQDFEPVKDEFEKNFVPNVLHIREFSS